MIIEIIRWCIGGVLGVIFLSGAWFNARLIVGYFLEIPKEGTYIPIAMGLIGVVAVLILPQSIIPWWLPLCLDVGTVVVPIGMIMTYRERKASQKADALKEHKK